MTPWPHTTITFVSSGEGPGHVTRDVLVNGTPVTVALGGVEVSQPASDDVQRVTLTLLPDEVHFIGPDGDTPASTETARNGDLSDDEADQATTARNLDAIKHELEAPMREHGECCEPAPADDLPGEPVEPGDLRAGDRVGFTWRGTGERIACNLVSVREGAILRSDAPDKDDYYPNVVVQGKWCSAISDVRLIKRAPREDEDPDEALANALLLASEASRGLDGRWVDVDWHAIARAAREHIEAGMGECYAKEDATAHDRAERAEAEQDELRDACNSWQSAAQEAEYLSEKFRAERDEFNGFWKDALADVRKARDERDGWKAKHAALREDVDSLRRNPKSLTDVLMRAADTLDRDDDRTPQAD